MSYLAAIALTLLVALGCAVVERHMGDDDDE